MIYECEDITRTIDDHIDLFEKVAEPGPRGAEATLGATASPLGQPSANCGLPEKARSPP